MGLHDGSEAAGTEKVIPAVSFEIELEEVLVLDGEAYVSLRLGGAVSNACTLADHIDVSHGLIAAATLIETLSLPEVQKFSVAGSFRRVAETSKDVDFIIATEQVETVREAILTRLVILETIAAGDTKVSVILDREEPVSVDFRMVKLEEYATAPSGH